MGWSDVRWFIQTKLGSARDLSALTQALDRGIGVEGFSAHGCVDERLGQLEREAPDLFLAVLDHDLEDAGFDRCRSAAERDRAPGLRLHRDGRGLERVRQRLRSMLASGLQRADVGEQRTKPGLETVDVLQHALGLDARHDRLDRGVTGPDVRAAQGADAADVHEDRCFLLGAVRDVP